MEAILLPTASILVHLSLGFSGEFSNPSVAEVGPRRIEAVLKGGNVGPQIHLTQSDGEVSSSEELSNAGFNDAEYSGADTEAAEPGKSVRVEAQSGVIDVARYYVRSELSQPPSVINDVVLGAPPTNIGFAWSLRLRLYLSESGIVDRLVVEGFNGAEACRRGCHETISFGAVLAWDDSRSKSEKSIADSCHGTQLTLIL